MRNGSFCVKECCNIACKPSSCLNSCVYPPSSLPLSVKSPLRAFMCEPSGAVAISMSSGAGVYLFLPVSSTISEPLSLRLCVSCRSLCAFISTFIPPLTGSLPNPRAARSMCFMFSLVSVVILRVSMWLLDSSVRSASRLYDCIESKAILLA